jgi:hypothetical protein
MQLDQIVLSYNKIYSHLNILSYVSGFTTNMTSLTGFIVTVQVRGHGIQKWNVFMIRTLISLLKKICFGVIIVNEVCSFQIHV